MKDLNCVSLGNKARVLGGSGFPLATEPAYSSHSIAWTEFWPSYLRHLFLSLLTARLTSEYQLLLLVYSQTVLTVQT